MSNESAILILASFDNEKNAEKALFDLKMDKRGRLIEFKDAALVNRDAEDKIHIKEISDLSSGKGVVYGGIVGAIIGLLTGPLGAAIGGIAGAVVGGIAAKKIDTGIPDERILEIAAALKPGTSAIMVIVEQRWFENVHMHLEEAGAELLTEKINKEFIDQVKTGEGDS